MSRGKSNILWCAAAVTNAEGNMGKGLLRGGICVGLYLRVICCCLGGILLTFFSLLSELPVSYLEQELQDTIKAKYGDLVPSVYFNKGL